MRLGVGGAAWRFAKRLLPLAALVLASCRSGPAVQQALRPIEHSLTRTQYRHWKHIVLHHSASAHGNALEFHRFHQEARGWDGLAYHFVIGNGHGSRDGEIEVGYRWSDQTHGAHAGNTEYNQYGIGICLVGDFEASDPTPAQRESLRALLRWLMRTCTIPATEIVRHKDVREGTECPGKRFPFDEIVGEVR